MSRNFEVRMKICLLDRLLVDASIFLILAVFLILTVSFFATTNAINDNANQDKLADEESIEDDFGVHHCLREANKIHSKMSTNNSC